MLIEVYTDHFLHTILIPMCTIPLRGIACIGLLTKQLKWMCKALLYTTTSQIHLWYLSSFVGWQHPNSAGCVWYTCPYVGLTSRLVELLREDYPNQYILCVSVAPFQSGETPTQHYNSLLCLHWLQTYCDCIMLVQNDAILHETAAQRMVVGRKTNDVSFTDMNSLISHCVCNCLMPLKGDNSKR